MKFLKRTLKMVLTVGVFAFTLSSCVLLGGVLDSEGPTISFTYPGSGGLVILTNLRQVIEFRGIVQDASEVKSVTINMDNTGPVPVSAFAGEWSVLLEVTEGQHRVEIKAKDTGGNESSEVFAFTAVLDSSDNSSSSLSSSSVSSSSSSSSYVFSNAIIEGLLQVPNALVLDGYSVDVTLDTDDDPANGGYTNIGFTFDSADPSYYFDGLPTGTYYVFAVIHSVSSAGELPVVGDFVGKLPMVVNVTDAGTYDYQDIQMKPMPAPFVLTVSGTDIQSGGSYVVSTNSFIIVDVQVSPTNAPLPVEISYFFTNISAGWTGALLSNSTDLSYSSFEIPVSSLQQLYSTASDHSSYVEVRAMDNENNMTFDGFTLTVTN